MKRKRTRASFAVCAAGLLAVAACAEDPTDVHVDEAIERVELVTGGATVASWDRAAGTWTGALDVGVGLETALVQVVFLDHDGEPIVFDLEHYLEVTVADESVAVFEQESAGGFAGRLHGVQAGSTTITFTLMHGVFPTGHLDERTSALAVTVS